MSRSSKRTLILLAVVMPLKSWCDFAGLVDNSGILDPPRRLRAQAIGNSSRRLGSVASWVAVTLGGMLVDQVPIEMYGTTFTADNYQREMIDFLIAGSSNDNGVAMQQWYLKGTDKTQIEAGLVRVGPGPNTTTHLGFEDVYKLLAQYPNKINSGSLERGNELGMQVLGSGAWPEAPGGIKAIGLGQNRENHGFARPYLANVLDKGSWSDEWLKHRANEFFSGRDKFDSSDVKWWVTQVLHKIHFDLDIDEARAKEFVDYMSGIVKLIPFPESVLRSSAADILLSATDILQRKDKYLQTFKSAIKKKYVGEDFVVNDSKVNLLTSVMLDSLQFAGGISMPTTINNVLALTHMATENRHDSLKGMRLSSRNYQWILWETLRKYAPVAGVPSWEKLDNGAFKHVVPNLATALNDASVFDNPLEFKNRGAAVYESKLLNTGLPWAGPAIQRFSDGTADTAAPHSHNCPAQDLSFRMMKAFIEAFVARGDSLGWAAADSGSISITSYGSSTFALLKRGLSHTTGCALFPSCNDGYSWVSTKWCWWGRRDWTCLVQ